MNALEQLWEWVCEYYSNSDSTKAHSEQLDDIRLSILKGCAITSPPKRKHAQVAQALLQGMQNNDNAACKTAADNVMHAYCWQQGTTDDFCAVSATYLYTSYAYRVNHTNATQLLIEVWSKAKRGVAQCQFYYDALPTPIITEESKLNVILTFVPARTNPTLC